ncbi:MAG TPA: hypothetical protein VFO91_12940 [Anaerolineales bacterium]|nr:hypothetical protein [Anaerolineales bacterium]
MRPLTVFLALFVVLTACTAPARDVPATPLPPATSIPAKPTSAPAGTAVPESPARNATLETSLLATEWKSSSEGILLFPLDPASGMALPGYPPISLGQVSTHAFSPDRHTLAVVSIPNDYAYDGSLLLIDLPAWKVRRFELEFRGWVSNMVFSPDGTRLAIAHGQSKHQITMVNVGKGVITAQREMGVGYVSRLKFTVNGEGLMLYGPVIKNRFTANEMNGGTPQVLLLDAADLSPRWSAALEGVRDGIYPKDENVTSANTHEPGQSFYLNPGLAFVPDQDTLYVVHADSEQMTIVDFSSQKVRTLDIQDQLTWFERLLSLTAGVAYAKIADGTSKQAAISPDGQFVYVVGANNATYQDQQGNWQMEHTPLGLEIIQTRDGSRLRHIETDAIELSISPDGRFLYLRKWGPGAPSTEILDTSNQQFVARKTRLSAIPALLMNGEFLLASTYSTSENSHHMSVLEPDGSNVLAEWKGSEYVWFLTTP